IVLGAMPGLGAALRKPWLARAGEILRANILPQVDWSGVLRGQELLKEPMGRWVFAGAAFLAFAALIFSRREFSYGQDWFVGRGRSGARIAGVSVAALGRDLLRPSRGAPLPSGDGLREPGRREGAGLVRAGGAAPRALDAARQGVRRFRLVRKAGPLRLHRGVVPALPPPGR